MKASDISDERFVAAVRATRGMRGVPGWATIWDVQKELAEFPPKVVVAKLRSLIRRGIVTGCPCGCRGDLGVPADGDPGTWMDAAMKLFDIRGRFV